MSLFQSLSDARLRFLQSRIEELIEAEKYSEALTAVIDLANWCRGRNLEQTVWTDLLLWATKIAAHLDDPGEYRAFLAHFDILLLGTSPEPSGPLLAALLEIQSQSSPALMIDLGRWVQDSRPGWALGPYVKGHFLEKKLRNREESSTKDGPTANRSEGELQECAQAFKTAIQRAEAAGQKEFALHLRLRAGAFLLTSQFDPEGGRELLHQIDWAALHPEDQLWMAIAMASSHLWTDRVRAMDILLDLHWGVDRALPEFRHLRLHDLRHGAATIFKLAALYMPEAEEQRLEELLDTLFHGPEKEQWAGYLQARKQLSKAANLPLEQTGDVQRLLDKLTRVYPHRWRSSSQEFEILLAGLDGSYNPRAGLPGPRTRARRLPVIDRLASALQAFQPDSIATLEVRTETIDKLLESLRELSPQEDLLSARPLAILWPRLLSQAQEHRRQILELAQEHHRLGTRPSYGWWLLSAHLFEAQQDEAGELIAARALSSDGPLANEIARFAASKAFHFAARSGNLEAMRRWLPLLP